MSKSEPSPTRRFSRGQKRDPNKRPKLCWGIRKKNTELWKQCDRYVAILAVKRGYVAQKWSQCIIDNEQHMRNILTTKISYYTRNMPGRTKRSDLPKTQQENFYKKPK